MEKKLLLFVFIFINTFAFGQSQYNVQLRFEKGLEKLNNKNYYDAIPDFNYAKKNLQKAFADIDSSIINYYLGVCYYNVDSIKERSIPYLRSYIAATDSIYDVHYLLAEMLHYEEDFDNAIPEYENFKAKILKDNTVLFETKETVIKKVDNEIRYCNYGKVFKANSQNAVVENLGPTINTIYSEYAQTINPTETKIAFTRRAPQNIHAKISPDGDYYEDVYLSDILTGSLMAGSNHDSIKRVGFKSLLTTQTFSPAQNMGSIVNSPGNDGSIEFSYHGNGSDLFIYKDNHVWKSHNENGVYQAPQKLGELENIINTSTFEPSISFSVDENTIYISSERPGGYGGLDIYKSEKINNVWSPAVNLGPEINTEFNEDAPYIDTDNKTLYFSSKGHNSMGGYDIFKSAILENKKWSKPTNMGAPLNSPSDDIFFVMPIKYNRAYFSSNRSGGMGKMDLYRITFAEERAPVAEIFGFVLKERDMLPIRSKISFENTDTHSLLGEFKSDSVSGEYIAMVGHNMNVKMKVETQGFEPFEKEMRTPIKLNYYDYYQEVQHVYLFDKFHNKIGQIIRVYTLAENDSIKNLLSQFNYTKDTSFFKKHPYLQFGESNLGVMEYDDVKFYITEDSLKKYLEENPDLEFKFPPGTSVSFVNPGTSHFMKDMKRFVNPIVSDQYVFSKSAYKNNDTKTNSAALYKKQKSLKYDRETLGYTDVDDVAFEISEDSLISFLTIHPDEEIVFKPGSNIAFTDPKKTASKRNTLKPINPEQYIFSKKMYDDYALKSKKVKNIPEDLKAANIELIVYFDFNKENPNTSLAKIKDYLQTLDAQHYTYQLTGHADPKGSASYNKALSKRRALAIRKFLINEYGIRPRNIKTDYLGESSPFCKENNDECNAQNRRVIIQITKK